MSENETPTVINDPNANNQSDDVISDYYDGVKKLEMEGYETGIKKARNALFITAGIVGVSEIITLAIADLGFPPFVIAVIAAEVGVFIGLALWTKTKPYTAIVVGLIVFIVMWIASIALVGGQAIYKGILVKAIIISVLVNALKPAKAWEDLKKNG
jgi:hypothetical protein